MKVILLKDIRKVGKKFEVKEVSSGHALNMLIPQGLAVAATPDALKRLEKTIAISEGARRIQEDLLAKNFSRLDSLTITIHGKANDKGHLFAGIHKAEIIAALGTQGVDIADECIELEHPIKEVGTHTIAVRAGNKIAKFKVVVEKA